MIKKVKLYLKIVEPLWSKHNLVLGEGILNTTSIRLEIFFIKCVRTEKPLSMTCDPLFEEFITESLHPQFRKLYHKKTNDNLFNIFWTKRSELYDEMRSANYKVSITSDIWSVNITCRIVLLRPIGSPKIPTLVHDF
jgi:hypothetical protein